MEHVTGLAHAVILSYALAFISDRVVTFDPELFTSLCVTCVVGVCMMYAVPWSQQG